MDQAFLARKPIIEETRLLPGIIHVTEDCFAVVRSHMTLLGPLNREWARDVRYATKFFWAPSLEALKAAYLRDRKAIVMPSVMPPNQLLIDGWRVSYGDIEIACKTTACKYRIGTIKANFVPAFRVISYDIIDYYFWSLESDSKEVPFAVCVDLNLGRWSVAGAS